MTATGRSHRAAFAAALLAGVLALGACTDEPDPVLPPVAGLSWQQLAPVPTPRTEVAAAASGALVYVIGGFTADGSTVATVEVLDTTTGTWSTGPDLPVPVNHAMATSIEDSVFLFGGYAAGNVPSAAAFRLDPSGGGGGTAAWRRVADLPVGLAAGTAVPVGDRVYLAGGIASGGGLSEQTLVYESATDTWSTAAALRTPREHLGGAGFNGRVYAVGGRTGGLSGNLTAFEVFDPGTGEWTSLPDLPTRRGGLAAAATCNGRVVAVGGEAAETFAEAEAFDVVSGGWSALPPLPTPRHGLGVVALGTTLYTLAGGARPGLHVAGSTEVIDLGLFGSCRG